MGDRTDITATMCWQEHRGQRIIVCDYHGLSGADYASILRRDRTATLRLGIKPNEMLSVNIVTDCVVDREVLAEYKQHGQLLGPLVKKSAVVGAVGVHKFFLRLIMKFSTLDIHQFDKVEEALNWLAR